ncbi:MAG TPA: NAD-dependent epimerase/dehydratase family protein [Bryobacteraceae bacterium]|nr:NAD-dependent epimerase/dehydratase family protein [Bryobacteraceae bacterium]
MELHVIFGGGQVGQPLARILRERGLQVRMARRASGAPDGVELMRGDATDRNFCLEAARGASTVYHCMNPPYSTRVWAEVVPKYVENLIAAAESAGARLVVLESLYMLGRTSGRPMNEDTPMNPCSRKGEIRAREAERLFAAHRRGEVRATAGRASDYYGPGATLSHVGDQFWKPVIAGGRGRVLVDPDAIHTYHYVPDVAAGLATLGTAGDDAYGKPWMLPCTPAETMRALVARFSPYLGRNIGLTIMPGWALSALSLFVPMIREIKEMMYQWGEPFLVEDKRFRDAFHAQPADSQRAAADTVAWAKSHYSRQASKAN